MILKRCVVAIFFFAMVAFPEAIFGAILAAAHAGISKGVEALPADVASSPSTIRNKRSYRDIMLRYMDKPQNDGVLVDSRGLDMDNDEQNLDELSSPENRQLSDLVMGPYSNEVHQKSTLQQRPLLPFRGKRNGFAAFRGKKSGFSAFRGKKSETGSGYDNLYRFSGFRGRRGDADADYGFSAFRGKKGAEGFVGFRGKKPSGFMTARGKRFNRNGSRDNQHHKRAEEQEEDLVMDNSASIDNESLLEDNNNTNEGIMSSNNGIPAPAVVFLKSPDSYGGISSFLESIKAALVEPDSELHNYDAITVRNRNQRSALGTNMGFLFATPPPPPRNV